MAEPATRRQRRHGESLVAIQHSPGKRGHGDEQQVGKGDAQHVAGQSELDVISHKARREHRGQDHGGKREQEAVPGPGQHELPQPVPIELLLRTQFDLESGVTETHGSLPDMVFNGALSPDGSRLALARGGIVSDVLLLSMIRN